MSEFGDGPETCGTTKICRYCEYCTRDYTTSKHYCLRVNWGRMIFLGPRRVAPTDTCKFFDLHTKFLGRSR